LGYNRTMEMQSYIKTVIQEQLELKRMKNTKFSLRMLATEMQIPVAALSSFLSGKRNFSYKMAKRVFENLALPPDVFIELENINHNSKESSDIAKHELHSSLYYLVSEPLYYSYLCLVETVFFKDDDEWAANTLDTSLVQIQKIKSTLLDLKFIKYEKGKLVTLPVNLATTDNIPNQSLRARHAQNCEDAKQALYQTDVDKRYFGFETLAFDTEDLPLVQKKINQLFDDLILLSQRGQNKDSVYEFSSFYFPRAKT
jgi:uncharacterized protein (TIGR02147 family)